MLEGNLFEQAKRSVNSTASNTKLQSIMDRNKTLEDNKIYKGLSSMSSKLGDYIITTKMVNVEGRRLNRFFKMRKNARLKKMANPIAEENENAGDEGEEGEFDQLSMIRKAAFKLQSRKIMGEVGTSPPRTNHLDSTLSLPKIDEEEH
jgi:hypothetical protein